MARQWCLSLPALATLERWVTLDHVSSHGFLKLFTQAAFSQPVLEPVVGDPRWGGLEVVTALVQTPGHWVNYTKVAGVWWCQDSAGPPVAVPGDPFLTQSANNTIQELGFRV